MFVHLFVCMYVCPSVCVYVCIMCVCCKCISLPTIITAYRCVYVCHLFRIGPSAVVYHLIIVGSNVNVPSWYTYRGSEPEMLGGLLSDDITRNDLGDVVGKIDGPAKVHYHHHRLLQCVFVCVCVYVCVEFR